MLNMCFHNEHHDFPMVAWRRLPQLSRLAPDFYQTLYAHQSYTRLLWHFVFDKNLSAFSRWVRSDAQKHEEPASHYRHARQTFQQSRRCMRKAASQVVDLGPPGATGTRSDLENQPKREAD